MQFSRALIFFLVAAAACGPSSSNAKDAGDDGGSGDDDDANTSACTAPNMLILLDRTGTMHRNLAGVRLLGRACG